MKSKITGIALAAGFVLLVVYIAFRVSAIRNLITGSTSAPAA